MTKFDSSKPSKYIMCLDSNNLCGWALSQYLTTGGFKWKKVDGLNLAKYTEKNKKGLILEVNLKYPQQLHDIHRLLTMLLKN